MAPRSIKPEDGENLPSSATEPSPPAHLPVLERGAMFTLHATVLRIDQIWVTFNVAGEMVRVLRSRLERELNP